MAKGEHRRRKAFSSSQYRTVYSIIAQGMPHRVWRGTIIFLRPGGAASALVQMQNAKGKRQKADIASCCLLLIVKPPSSCLFLHQGAADTFWMGCGRALAPH